jgi:Zn-dependent protease with chaperone function
VADALDPIVDDLRAKLDITSSIRVLVDVHNSGKGAYIIAHLGRHDLVVSLGLLELVELESEAFRAIVAHELAHVAQKDAILLPISQAMSGSLGFAPPALMMVLSGAYFMWVTWWAGAIMLVSAAPLAATRWLLRDARRRSEELADFAAAIWVSPTGIADAIRLSLSDSAQASAAHPPKRDRLAWASTYARKLGLPAAKT